MTATVQQSEQYIIRGGTPGRNRLEILNRALTPTTQAFFQRAGLTSGQHGLDLGCGGGAATLALAEIVGFNGSITGIDWDAENIAFARQRAETLGMSQAQYQQADVRDWERDADSVDFAYGRFLMTHLDNPAALARKVRRMLKPGGRILLEDIDFAGHFCSPACRAFDQYVEWYTEAARRRGADPNIGPRLPQLVREAGFRNIQFNIVQPVFQTGEGKQMASLTLENIADALASNQLASGEMVADCLAELRAFEQDENTLVSLPRIFQVWAVK
ncbi:MAG: methyltransferase domain-containing protein [Phaeodactylibacter sp.]|nr:methyltransferase domain-containing protein [Phaeodactylibacter sp.]MCB9291966.1 methyltransferase domain-containing protein [Lewinellaceae bacterium]